MNSITRFQNIALKILGGLLIAVGINQLVDAAQSQWSLSPFDRCPWHQHHRTTPVELDGDRHQMHERIHRDVRLAMESVRHELDEARREMEDVHRERKEAMQEARVQMRRFR